MAGQRYNRSERLATVPEGSFSVADGYAEIQTRVPDFTAPPPAVAMDPSAMRAIVVSRAVAIFFMMYVHAWAGAAESPDDAFTGSFGTVVHLLVDVLGRSSVPLLTIISGYLLVTAGYRRRNWREVVADKARTLLVPMWLWNGALLLMIWGAVTLFGGHLPDYVIEEPWYNSIFALTGRPATLPLAFLRDMFVCALLSPILIRLMQLAPWPVLALAAAFAIFHPEQPIILRPQLLLFYLVGIGFALHWQVPRKVRLDWPTWVAAVVLIICTLRVWLPLPQKAGSHDLFIQLLSNSARFAVAWLVWMACLALQRSGAYSRIARVESVIFLAFCSHFLLFRALGHVLPDDTQWLPLIFLIQPPLAIAAAFAMSFALRGTAPRLLSLLNAGKLPRLRT
ncbi:acyltransferase family protein [Sandaracinobacteroides hominis]|uniref:acyltransferase family protein n=1 Tax=Sandaracinobacteroides hominis TaxID=2780086 RepID=UPI0018F5A587|nr:acyltransferase [Sandaracinobacteroides hominis]